MLELPSLWLSPPELSRDASHHRGTTIRTVRMSPTGRELGCIVAFPLRWWPWNMLATISAFEGPDRSALFAGRRAGWLPGDWDVHEADGRLVGLVRGSHVMHAAGDVLGRILREKDAGAGRIVGSQSARLTAWKPEASGTRIEFAPELAEQPFAKMAVIIAVLIGL